MRLPKIKLEDVTVTQRLLPVHRLGVNGLGDEGTITICKALSESKVSKLQELELNMNGVGPLGGEALANMLLVHTALTSLE